MFELANKEDIDELSQLRIMQQKDDWKEEYIRDDQEFFEEIKKYLEKHLNQDLYFWIKRMNEKIVATCGIQITERMAQCIENGLEGYICNVFTLKEYRNKGIQTGLIEQCIEFSRKKRVDELCLLTDNPNAIRIYERFGFEFDDLTMRRYRED